MYRETEEQRENEKLESTRGNAFMKRKEEEKRKDAERKRNGQN